MAELQINEVVTFAPFWAFFSGADISLMDGGTIIASLSLPAGRLVACKFKKRDFHLSDLFLDLLRGATIFPFIVLLLASINSALLTSLMSGNRVVIMLAAIIGLVAVWNSDKWMKERLRQIVGSQ